MQQTFELRDDVVSVVLGRFAEVYIESFLPPHPDYLAFLDQHGIEFTDEGTDSPSIGTLIVLDDAEYESITKQNSQSQSNNIHAIIYESRNALIHIEDQFYNGPKTKTTSDKQITIKSNTQSDYTI